MKHFFALMRGFICMEEQYFAADTFAPCHAFCVAKLISADEAFVLTRAADELDAWNIRGAYRGNLTCDVDALALPEAVPAIKPSMALLAGLYHIPESAIRLTDLRVVKYSVSRDSIAGLPLHSDGSALSFVCALNDCGEAEGGTYVRHLDRVITPSPGHALFFCGRWVHAGVPLHIPNAVRYVLTGFLDVVDDDEGAATFSPARMLLRALDRVVEHENVANVAHRLCPGRSCWLHREFAGDWTRGGGAGSDGLRRRQCSRCNEDVPRQAVRHCCGDADSPECGCGTAWCNACLQSSAASEEERAQAAVESEPEVAPEDEEPSVWCEFLGDETIPNGTTVEPGEWFLKVWRLRWTRGEGGLSPCALSTLRPSEAPRLVRVDLDTDERIGSRDRGNESFTQIDASDEDLLAAVDIRAPPSPGAYRIFFRLLEGPLADAPLVGGDNELYADFEVKM